MRNSIIVRLLILFVVASCIGCFGGGGSSKSKSSNGGNNNPPPAPDPLRVTEANINTIQGQEDLISQIVGDIDIEANLVNIDISFNKALGELIRNSMNPESDDIYLSYLGAGQDQTAALEIQVSGSSVSLQPKLDLRPNTLYTLNIKSDIQAADGSSLDSAKAYQFRTKDVPPSPIDEWIVFRWLPAGEDINDNPITEDGFGFFAQEIPENVMPGDVSVVYTQKDILMSDAINNPDMLELEEGWLGRRIHMNEFNLGDEQNPIRLEFDRSYVFRLTAFLWVNSFHTSKNESALSENFKVVRF